MPALHFAFTIDFEICFFQALLFGGGDSLPFFLARQYIPGLDIVVDPCAAVLVIIVTGLLCVGIKEVIPLSD